MIRVLDILAGVTVIATIWIWAAATLPTGGSVGWLVVSIVAHVSVACFASIAIYRECLQ